jgi:hypothetical protein
MSCQSRQNEKERERESWGYKLFGLPVVFHSVDTEHNERALYPLCASPHTHTPAVQNDVHEIKKAKFQQNKKQKVQVNKKKTKNERWFKLIKSPKQTPKYCKERERCELKAPGRATAGTLISCVMNECHHASLHTRWWMILLVLFYLFTPRSILPHLHQRKNPKQKTEWVTEQFTCITKV